MLASFGSGPAEISVRVVAPHGVVSYQAQARTDQDSSEAGATLLGQSQITLSASAQQQLRAGQVDQRLVVALADLSIAEPMDIVDFGNDGPGASPDVPLRVADLAATDQSANIAQGAYVQAMHEYLNAESAQFRPASSILTLPDGQVIFRVDVTAPTPHGLLSRQ